MCIAALRNTFPQKQILWGALRSGVRNAYGNDFTLLWGARRKPFHILTFPPSYSPDAAPLMFIAMVLKEARLQGHWDCTDTAQNLSQRFYSLSNELLSFSSSLGFWGHCLTFWQACSSLSLLPVSPLWNTCIAVSFENSVCRTTEFLIYMQQDGFWDSFNKISLCTEHSLERGHECQSTNPFVKGK